jgi:hypothetical protein
MSASVPDRALVSDQAATRLDPSGFDPSRVFAEMDRYIDDVRAKGGTPGYFRVAEPLLRDLSSGTSRRASYRGIPFHSADEWSWGWMLWVERNMFFKWEAHFWQLSDSDGSPEGEKPQALSAQHDSAGPKGIAQTPASRNPNP